MIMSFDVWDANLPRIEIYGSEGSLSVPDPNRFGGPVRLWRHDAREWREMPLTSAFVENWRGLGVADMALALRDGRPHCANGDLAYHVLDIMHAIHDASREGRSCRIDKQLRTSRAVVGKRVQGKKAGSTVVKARISPTMRFTLVIGAVCFASVAAIRADENIMIQEDNMKELKCSLPNDRFRLVESNSPGQLFLSDEPVDLKLAFKKGDLNGSVPFSLEIQEVGTRTQGKLPGA